MKAELRGRRRWIGVACFALILLAGGVGYWTRPAWPSRTMPNPNGYELLVIAGDQIAGDLAQPEGADLKSLKAFVDSNLRPLQSLREAIRMQSRVPLGPDPVETLQRNQEASRSIRKLSRLGIAAGRLAEVQGQEAQALGSYLDMARMGRTAAFGGLVTDELQGISVRRQMIRALERQRTRLDARACRTLVDALKALDSASESPAAIIARDHEWSLATSPWWVRTNYEWNSKVRSSLDQLAQKGYRAFELASETDLSSIRRLHARSAARLARLNSGHEPSRMADLVPRYLPAVPRDPISGAYFRLSNEAGDGPVIEETLPELVDESLPDSASLLKGSASQ